MNLKKAKLWRVLWRQKSRMDTLAQTYATSYEEYEPGSSRSSHSRSDSRSSGSDLSLSSVQESIRMSNNDTSNGETNGSRGMLHASTPVDRNDPNFLCKKRSDTGSSTGSAGRSSRPKSLPVESHPSKRKHSSESSEDHTPSRLCSISRHSSEQEEEISRQQHRHVARVHSIPEIQESHLTKSCEVSPVTGKNKKDAHIKKSHSIASMSTVLETPTSSRPRDHHDIPPASRRISASSHDSDDIIKKSFSKSHKISNIKENQDDENNNREKSKKSKKKGKSHDSPSERPRTPDLNITVQNGDAEEEDDIGNIHKKLYFIIYQVHAKADETFR